MNSLLTKIEEQLRAKAQDDVERATNAALRGARAAFDDAFKPICGHKLGGSIGDELKKAADKIAANAQHIAYENRERLMLAVLTSEELSRDEI